MSISTQLPDVQASSPDIRINLTRVGVKNIRKLVEVARAGGKRPVIPVSYTHLTLPTNREV